jgi:hypothetical protein
VAVRKQLGSHSTAKNAEPIQFKKMAQKHNLTLKKMVQKNWYKEITKEWYKKVQTNKKNCCYFVLVVHAKVPINTKTSSACVPLTETALLFVMQNGKKSVQKEYSSQKSSVAFDLP